MKQKNIELLIKISGFAVGAVAVWLILRRLGLTKTAVEREGDKNIADTFTVKEINEQKQNATLTDSELRAIASTIKNSWHWYNDEEEKIYNAFSRLNNYNDLMLVIRYYGTFKGEGLEDSITSRMSEREVNKVNEILNSKGINFNF